VKQMLVKWPKFALSVTKYIGSFVLHRSIESCDLGNEWPIETVESRGTGMSTVLAGHGIV